MKQVNEKVMEVINDMQEEYGQKNIVVEIFDENMARIWLKQIEKDSEKQINKIVNTISYGWYLKSILVQQLEDRKEFLKREPHIFGIVVNTEKNFKDISLVLI